MERSHAPFLSVAGVLVIATSLYRPDRIGEWLLENLLVVLLVVVLVFIHRRIPLSNTSYWMLFIFLCIHEWGAHHKYADVPLGEWMKGFLGTPRNHYDRVAHFAFGLCFAYPFQELLIRTGGVQGAWRYYLPVDIALAFGGVYEIIEAGVASLINPDSGESFVSMQGDIWDAQKDIALAGIGAALMMTIVAVSHAYRATPEFARPPAQLTLDR